MSKRKAFKTRLLYVLAIVAVLAMMIPLAVTPVSAQVGPLPSTATPPFAHDLIGDTETFSLAIPAGYTVVSVNTSNTANGPANASVIATQGIGVPGPVTVNATIQGFGFGETAVTFLVRNDATGAITPITSTKKFGKIDATRITNPQSVPVVWNESTKVWSANATITDTVIGTFQVENAAHTGFDLFEEPVNGAVLNWFLLKDNLTTQAWLSSHLSGGSPAGWWVSGTAVADLTAAADTGNWWSTFAKFAGNGTFTTTTTNSAPAGSSTVTVTTTGEEAILVVVIPQYPNLPQSENRVPIEWTKLNFWTPEMEKVPQVRWAGEKIVLEKFFGTGPRPNEAGTAPLLWPGTLVRFSLENQSPGSLEGIGPGANLANFTNTAQTVWTIVGPDGYARCMLVSEAPGEVDVDLAVYNENIFMGGDGDNLLGGTIINQHGFVVFYLKLEEITLGNVLGKRADHNAGLWEPTPPAVIWDPATDVAAEELNVSQDALLRARVKGWFMGDNMSVRPERLQDYDNDGSPDVLLPRGRWVLPDDWPKLAGPDWAEQRIHWDIMDNPFDTVRSQAPTVTVGPTDPRGFGYYGKIDVDPTVAGYHGSGSYYQPLPPPPGTLKAAYPVIGPFRPGIELPTFNGYDPAVQPFAVPKQKSVVPNGVLDWWDAPMPPAKITFEILRGNGFFKEALKSDIYYIWDSTAHVTRYYTNPFYFEMIPASWYIPAFVNNGGYDWDSWAGVTVSANGTVALPKPSTPVAWAPYGPYEFWKIFNRPPGTVASTDSANFPTKVQVYSDNHGEAMVWLNGNWNLNLLPFFSNGAADVPPGATVGTTVATAMADYPYFRKHPKLVSTNVTKTWTWGGIVLGVDQFTFNPPNNNTILPASATILSTGNYQILPVEGVSFPDEIAFSNKKVVFVWLSDRDISPLGVRDAVINWSVGGNGLVRIAKNFGTHIALSQYNATTQNIFLTNGFLEGTNGQVIAGSGDTQGISGVTTVTPALRDLFNKTYGTQYPNLDANDFVVAAVELINTAEPLTPSVTLHVEIRSLDFGITPGTAGTLSRNITVNFGEAHPLDDAPLYGDATADGVINMGDVIAVERMILGLKAAYVGADANQDHKINMGDVITIERIILGLE